MTDIRHKTTTFFTTYPTRTFSRGQIIINPYDPLREIFYLVEGRVSQYDINANGMEVIVNVFKPGAFFPMSWAINNTQNFYFYEASIQSVAHIVPPADALQFLQDNPDVTFDLLARVYRGSDGLLRRMAHLMGGDAKSRLHFEILNAANRFGERQRNGKVFVPLKEGDLARHAGLTRETVNRHIQRLKKEGLVQVTHKGLVLPDVAKIEERLGREL